MVRKQTIHAKYHSCTPTGRFVQLMGMIRVLIVLIRASKLAFVQYIAFKLILNYLIYELAVCALFVEFVNLCIYLHVITCSK